MKHYKGMKQKDFDVIKGLIAQGIVVRDIHAQTGRSHGTIARINRSGTFRDYKESLTEYNLSMKKARGMVPHNMNNHGEFPKVDSRKEEALELLQKSFDDLQEKIVTVVELEVNSRVAEFKREKEIEIAALKTVVDAAKQTNLVTNLKNRLMGN